MGYKLITKPAVEPVTLEEAKLQLYLDTSWQDSRVTSMISSARRFVERQTNRRLITQEWRYSLDRYPVGVISTNVGPVQSIDALKFTDTDGTVVTVDPSEYLSDVTGEVARITTPLFQPWPWTYWAGFFGIGRRLLPSAVVVEFTAGYGDEPDDVPEDLKQAMLLIVAHWFNNREAVITGVRAAAIEVPQSSKDILDAYRIMSLG